ncbi:MAG: hypothetical protein ACM3JH_10310 [Acidithiobacillales bacterium]
MAFLIPPKVRVTNDEAATDTWRDGRQDYTVVYAAGSVWSSESNKALLQKSVLDVTWAACSAKDFIVSKKTGLLKLWTKSGDGFKAVWAKKEDLVEFSFPPDETTNASVRASRNLAAAAQAAELELDRVRGASFKPPEIENQRVFAADFDNTWAAMIETLSDEKWQIESIDRASGLVTTKPAIESGGASMACATKLDEAHKTWLNVFVKRVDTGTRVRVNATFRAMREDQAITCSSNGTLEKAFFEAIQKNLGGQ